LGFIVGVEGRNFYFKRPKRCWRASTGDKLANTFDKRALEKKKM